MLDRDDLNKIRGIVKEEVREIVREEVREVVREEVSVQLKPVNRKLNRLQKNMNFIVKDYNNAIVHVRRRVQGIEDHLGITPRV